MRSPSSLPPAVRPFLRNPGFALAVIATLALGIAPNCVIFAIMDAVYFRPLPYPAQDQLVLLNVARKDGASLGAADGYTFAGWRAGARSFSGLAAYRGAGFNVTVDGQPRRLTGQLVTRDFFPVLGMTPVRGRAFTAADCVAGAPRVLILGYRAWMDDFDGRADIVNLPVRLDGAPATIVGVMPEGFTSFMEGRSARAWAPLAIESAAAPGGAEAGVIGRMSPGTSLARAEAEMESVQASLVAPFPEALRDRRVVVRDFRTSLFGGLGPGLRMLTVIVGLLLLIACANAANLLIARATTEVRNVALRTALGAGRLRLVAARLAESLVLAAAAAVVGLLLAWWGTRLVWAQAAPIFTRIGVYGIVVDERALVFALALTVLTALLFGVGPAMRGSRADVASILKAGAPGAGRGRHAGRLSRALVVGQVALCVIALVVATLMARSFLHFSGLASNPGFDPSRLMVATLPPQEGGAGPDASRLAAIDEMKEGAAAVPGVELVALTSRLPFLEAGEPASASRRPPDAPGAAPRFDAELRAVDGAYFAATSAALLRGRVFTAQDGRDAPAAAVIDERLAHDAWGAGDPVGDRVFVDGVPRTIVGVVRVSAQPSPFRPTARQLFVPYAQAARGEVTLMARTRLGADEAAAAVRRAVAAVDPDQPVSGLQPLTRSLDEFMTPFRLLLSLIALFGSTALGLAALGLYSVIARGVSRRAREIGIRMALGAGRREIVGLVMREGLRSALVGLGVGLLLGFAVARILPSEILGVNGLAPWHYLGAAAIWLAAAGAACWLPARRAAASEPVTALRCE